MAQSRTATTSLPSENSRLTQNAQPLNSGNVRTSIAGWQAYRRYRLGSEIETGGRTANLGPVRLSLNAGTAFSFETNINNSPTRPLADFYSDAFIQMELSWRATRRNELQITVGIDYRQYYNYSEFNQGGLLLAPFSALDYRIFFGDFVLTLYDFPSITTNGGDQSSSIIDRATFRQFTNRGGISLLWHLNKLQLLGGIERADTISLDPGEFNSQNSVGYTVYSSATYEVTPTTSAGVRTQATYTDYTDQILNDAIFTTTGLFVETQLTDYTDLYAEAGIQTGTFFQTGQQGNQTIFIQEDDFNVDIANTLGGRDFVQPYFTISLTNRLNRYLTHTIGFGRIATGSNVSDYQENNFANYQLTYRLNRFTDVTGKAAYEFGSLSRTSSNIPFQTFRTGLNVNFRVLKNTSVGVGYEYIYYEASDIQSGYDNQIATIFLRHRF